MRKKFRFSREMLGPYETGCQIVIDVWSSWSETTPRHGLVACDRSISQRAPCAVELPHREAQGGQIIVEPVLCGLHHVYRLSHDTSPEFFCAPQVGYLL